MWGAWLVLTAVTFSLMAGIFHAYYTVALAPAIAAVVGIGAALVWERRPAGWALAVLAAVTLATSGWAFVLLGRSGDFLPWLHPVVLVAGVAAAAGLLAGRRIGVRGLRTAAAVALVAALAGPAAYTVSTVTTAHTGSIVTAGPAVAGGAGGPGGAPGGPRGGFGAGRPPGGPGQLPPQAGTAAGRSLPGRPSTGQLGARPGGVGALLDGSTPSATLTALLLKNAGAYTWVAATVGANSAAGYQLATQQSVLPIGGFNGSDPSPTLAAFRADVAAGKIHYFISGGGFGPARGGSSASGAISAWVQATFTAQTVAGVTLYDLTAPATGG